MISQPELSYFIIASLLLIIAPGPDIIFLTTQSISNGPKAGFLTALGLASGNLVHTAAAAFGLSVLVQTSTLVFNSLKFLGVAYLLYLAYQLITSDKSTNQQAITSADNHISFYRKGLLINVLNPKIALFFVSFLPQFVPASSTHMHIDIIILGVVFTAMVILIFGSVGLLAGKIKQAINISSLNYNYYNWIIAVIFIFLAINLVLSSQN